MTPRRDRRPAAAPAVLAVVLAVAALIVPAGAAPAATNAATGAAEQAVHDLGTFWSMVDADPTANDLVGGPDGLVWVADAAGTSVWRFATDGLQVDVVPTGKPVTQMVVGPDGNVWATSRGGNAVGRITPAGVVTWFTHAATAAPGGIVVGPDGALWFTSAGAATVGRVTTAGVVTDVGVPGLDHPTTLAFTPDGDLWVGNEAFLPFVTRRHGDGTTEAFDVAGPVQALVAGPGGKPWFICAGANGGGSVETITDGQVVEEGYGGVFRDLVVGPDGDVWVTDQQNFDPLTLPYPHGWIARLDPQGALVGVVDTTGYGPGSIAVGPDGALWVANEGRNFLKFRPGGSLTRLTTSWTTTHVPFDQASAPQDLAFGPDGTALVADTGHASIETVSPAGLPAHHRTTVEPTSIAAGPAGTVWAAGPLVADPDTSAIVRLSPDGALDTFSDPVFPDPTGITLGPDGNLWFLARSGHAVGRITPDGVITRFDDGAIDTAGERGHDIVAGPDGNLWFANAESLGRITPAGAVATFASPTGSIAPEQLAFDAAGGLWFTDAAHHAIGARSAAGAFTTITDDRIVAPRDLAVGPGGAVWFTIGGEAPEAWLGYVSPAGELSRFRVIDRPLSAIAAAPDGNMAFASAAYLWLVGTAIVPAVPTPPPGIAVRSLGSGKVEVSWDPPDHAGSSPVLRYVVTAWHLWPQPPGNLPVPGCTADAPARSCTIATLLPTHSYEFTVRAVNAVGSSPLSDRQDVRIQVPFRDLLRGAPFEADIEWMAASGITTGYADGTFRPALPVSRLAMAAFLDRVRHPWPPAAPCTEAPFTDVPVGSPLCGEVASLEADGIVHGFPDGSFHPHAPVTREAMAAFLHRMSGEGGDLPAVCSEPPFTDVAVGAPFCGEIAWMKAAGIATGYSDGSFHPHEPIARQAMAAFLHRFHDR